MVKQDLRSLCAAEVRGIEQARDWILRIQQEVQKIELQLGDCNRRSATGQRLTPVQYQQWRTNALTARYKLLEQLRGLKQYIKFQQQAEFAPVSESTALLRKLYGVTKTILAKGNGRVELAAEEQQILDAVRFWIS